MSRPNKDLEEESFIDGIGSSDASDKEKLPLPKNEPAPKKKINSQQLQRKLTLGLLDKLVDQLTVEIKDPEHETQQSKKPIQLRSLKLISSQNVDISQSRKEIKGIYRKKNL